VQDQALLYVSTGLSFIFMGEAAIKIFVLG
jgi:hypothetical protein